MTIAPPEFDELTRLQLFNGLDQESIENLLSKSSIREVSPGETVIALGQINEYVYLLLAGRLCVYFDEEGVSQVILDAGESVGELSIIDNRPTSAGVVAETHCRLLVISEYAMWQLVTESHPICINLLNIFSTRLRASNNRLTEAEKQHLKLEHMASIDPMTTLYNRRWLDNNIASILQQAVAISQPVSILMIDLDHFKNYNDTQGHLAGDRAIITVAQTIMNNLRPMDRAVRYGGEEFLAILPNTNKANAHSVGDDLCRIIRNTPIIAANGDPLPLITISVGSATMETTINESKECIIKRADSALYEAKETGRDRVCSAD